MVAVRAPRADAAFAARRAPIPRRAPAPAAGGLRPARGPGAGASPRARPSSPPPRRRAPPRRRRARARPSFARRIARAPFALTTARAAAHARSPPASTPRAAAADEPASPSSGFADLGLAPELVAATDAMGLATPTEIQAAAIPAIRAGGHHLVASHTGSGKTLTYILPIVDAIRAAERESGGARARPKRPKALVVGPTRELAEQVRGVAKFVSHHARFSSELIIGGDRFATQRINLDRPLDVVVGTPGRLVKHIEEGNLHTSAVTHVVLDEADTLFEAGFGEEIRRLLRPLKKDPSGVKQCVVVSATMSKRVVEEIRAEFPDLNVIDTPSLHKSAPNLKHRFVDCPGSVDKMAVVEQIVSGDFRGAKKTMVFCNTLGSCQAVEYALQESELPVVMYNGDMTSEQRQASMKEFVDGDFQRGTAVVMVCTDLAARGLDFGGGQAGKVEHVVNFDFPMNPIDYIHRSGRTARAGATGKVTNLVTKKDRVLANEIDVAVKLGQPLDSATSSKAVADARQRKETLARKVARQAARGRGRGGGGGRAGRARRRARRSRGEGRQAAKANRRRGRGREEEPEGRQGRGEERGAGDERRGEVRARKARVRR